MRASRLDETDIALRRMGVRRQIELADIPNFSPLSQQGAKSISSDIVQDQPQNKSSSISIAADQADQLLPAR
jgi:hypothetical protein